jgi:hypothetical protein
VEYEETDNARAAEDSFELLSRKRRKAEVSEGKANAVRVKGQRNAPGKGTCTTWEPLPAQTYTGMPLPLKP